jgi:hypothetical protein
VALCRESSLPDFTQAAREARRLCPKGAEPSGPPLSQCIADCSFGTTPCLDGCVDDELGAGELENAVLLPQCLFPCEQKDDNCLDSCSYVLI